MATPRAAQHRDMEQRLRDLEKQVRELTGAALRREQLGVDSGDFVVSGGGGVVVRDGGNVSLLDADGSLVWDALSGPTVVRSARNSRSDFNITTPWSEYIETEVTVPDGFSRGHLIVMVAAGHTFRDTGNLSVEPTAWGSPCGPPVNSGNSDTSVATSFGARSFGGVGRGTSFPTVRMAARVTRSGQIQVQTGNVHLAALVTFQR